MRLRRKKNLEGRLDACGEMLICPVLDTKDCRRAVEVKELFDFSELFGNDAPVHLEIGCGLGGFACALAKREPQINILAVEKNENAIVEGCERAITEKIPNIRFLAIGAEYLLKYIPESSIERIYLNFSCPFPKSTYANHRLTNRRFLQIYEKLLLPGGEIHQKTDNMGFFEYSIQEYSQSGYCLKHVSLDLHKSGFSGNIMTEYERKFTDLGKPIYRLEAYLPQKEEL